RRQHQLHRWRVRQHPRRRRDRGFHTGRREKIRAAHPPLYPPQRRRRIHPRLTSSPPHFEDAAMRLAGKIALVSGAGTLKKPFTTTEQVGNGAACAIRFAREGATVACTDRVLAAAEETAGMIRAEGGQAYALALDVTDTS